MTKNRKTRLAVFASGRGSTAKAILEYQRTFLECSYNPVLIVSSSATAGVIDIARCYDIPFVIIREQESSSRIEYEASLLNTLREYGVEFISLAGYLRKIPQSLIEYFPNAIVNIHPSLLPKYGGGGMYGMNVHKAVSESGEAITGCTVHWVDSDYDTGKIIAQQSVMIPPYAPAESIAELVQEQEREFYPRVLNNLLSTPLK